MSQPLDNPPYKADLDDANRKMTGDWIRWLEVFWQRVRTGVQAVGASVAVVNQSAATATTTVQTVTQNGFYRLSAYLRVTVVDGVSSSLQLTLSWREGSQTCSKTFPALTGDTVTTFDSQTWTVQADSGTLLRYAVAYASNTPLKMRYRLSVSCEQVQ